MKRDWMISLVTILALGLMFISLVNLMFGCSGVQIDGEVNDTEAFIIEETVDAFGYGLGLVAYKDPELRKDVETYYHLISEQGITMAGLNALFSKYADQDPAYELMIYKLTRLIKRMGGTVLPDGTIETLGAITKEHLEIGKNSYLLAIKTAEVANE